MIDPQYSGKSRGSSRTASKGSSSAGRKARKKNGWCTGKFEHWPEKAIENWNAGADIVVVGTAFENDPGIITEISNAKNR